MHDTKTLIENLDEYAAKLKTRNFDLDVDALRSLHADHKKLSTQLQDLQSERNKASEEIGKRKRAGEDISLASENVRKINTDIDNIKVNLEVVEKALQDILHRIPNLPATDTPVGDDEKDNVLVRTEDHPNKHCANPKNHWDLLKGQLNFEAGTKVAGSRFTVLKGPLATLERAIGQFMLTNNIKHGYMEVATPSISNATCLHGTGQLPKFEDDLFKLNNGMYLIPTAEVTLTNLHNGDLIDEFTEPYRYTALTPCYRAEAGSAGKDMRGMIRQHQFNKVELVTICTEEQWEAEFDKMLGCACNILSELGLSYRVVHLCTGDMGFSAKRTYDIEVWLPGQNAFREISSVSWCGDFQARRMNLRYKKDKKNLHLNTLNGSSLAVGRTLVAVLENYQQSDGSIIVPEVLRPYTGFDNIKG